MTTLKNGILVSALPRVNGRPIRVTSVRPEPEHEAEPVFRDAEFLRRCAWEIGERRAADAYCPDANHVGLAMVTPREGFVHWRILQEWVDKRAWERGGRWHNCRLVMRLYDVSYIEFNGLNAHRIQDENLPGLCGQRFFRLPQSGTWQLAEVGFLLRDGEFIPAARSRATSFAPEGASCRGSQTALFVDQRRHVVEVGNLWDQERILRERRQPRLRQRLRIGALTHITPNGQQGGAAQFIRELAAGQSARGHEVHLFARASEHFTNYRQEAGVHYHPISVAANGTPLAEARAFGQAVDARLAEMEPLDLIHVHEWMAGMASRTEGRPTILSLNSIEATRRNGTPPDAISRAVEDAEREVARNAGCILTPSWLRERAIRELRIADEFVRAFPMEGRLPNEWEGPLDVGHVKMEIGFGPLDRMFLFIGPLEEAAGPDLLVDALPVLLQRHGNVRLACIGAGNLYGRLQHRAYQIGAAHAVRLLGHVEGPQVTRLLRAAEALVLPSRFRVPFDDAVIDLARRAGKPVITTHSGPAHLVRHEDNGLVTYDNPGSMVWALDRLVSDPGHGQRLGNNGRRSTGSDSVVWSEVAGHYLELCATLFPELSERSW
jgi:glycogen(starch) synthase